MIALIVILCVSFYTVMSTMVGVARYRWIEKRYHSVFSWDKERATWAGILWPITLLIVLGWKIGKEISRKF